MWWIKRKPKTSRGEREDPDFSPFLLMLVVAGIALVCLLLYALLYPVLFGDGDQEYRIVPYGSDLSPTPTENPIASLPTAQPLPSATFAPVITPTPAPTSSVPLPITASTVTGLTVSAQMSGLSAGVSGIAFSPDGTRIAAGSLDGTVRVWEVASRRPIFTLTSASKRVNSVAFSADGSRLIAGGQDNVVRWWDMSTGAELPPLTGPTASVNGVAFSPVGLIAAAASDDSRVYVWDLAADPGAVWITLRGHTSYVTSVAFSPDGTRIAAGGADRTIRVWTFASGAAGVSLTGHTASITAVAFSRDGTLLASTSADHTARLWNASTGAALVSLTGHTENVNAVAFSRDGTLLATGSGGINDDRVLLWRIPDGVLLHQLPSPGGVVNAVAFSPDGLRLAAGGATFLTMWTTTAVPLAPVNPTPGVQIQNDQALAGPTAFTVPSATFAPLATAGASGGCVLTVYAAEGGALYAAPDESAAQVGVLTLNQAVQPTGWTQGADGFTWWRLGNGAWARGDLFVTPAISLPDQCWSLPPVDASTGVAPILTPTSISGSLGTPGTAAVCTLTGLVDGGNLRAAPSAASARVGVLNAGQQVQAVGWGQDSDGYTWWKLTTGQWVRADVVEWPSVCQTLPRVTQ